MPLVAIDARLVGGTNTGDSTYWTGLLDGLARTAPPGARFLLFSNADRPAGIPDGPFHWQRISARSARWWSLVGFPLAARRAGARAIHTQYSMSPLVGRRGITTVHDVSFLIEPGWFKAKDRILMARTVPSSIRRAAATITVSETSKGEIDRLVPGGRVHVTYNACPPWIRPMPREEARAWVRGLGIEGPYALTVSTRWPRKNMRLAVDAVDLLPADLPHRLVVTGKAGWGDQEGGARTVPVGYVDEATLSALYSAADLYLCPSRHEGFGVPLLEAFRCGCPVMCSTGGALPEVAGDAAAVEPSWEPADWARRMEGLLRDRGTLDDLRRRGYERERRFTWEDTARKTLAVYREVGK